MAIGDLNASLELFRVAECSFTQTLNAPTPTTLGVGLFDEDESKTLPTFLKTGKQACGHPDVLKYFRGIRGYGVGQIWVRAMVDGTTIATVVDGHPLGMDEDPYKSRIFSFPRGTAGYWVDVELVIVGRLTLLEILWDAASDEGSPDEPEEGK